MRKWLATILVLAVWWIAPAALADDTPILAAALSSAGAGAGGTLTDGAGNAYVDASGKPITVLSVTNTASQATVMSLSQMMLVNASDLLGYSQSLGINLPLMLPGTLTTSRRSDGGVESVFTAKLPDGSSVLYMADQTGSNVYGIRIAHVQPSGLGTILTAHGLNGNFTNPPWYLSAAAKQNYWITTQTAMVFTPTPVVTATQSVPVAGASSGSMPKDQTLGSPRVWTSDMSVGPSQVTLSGTKRREAQGMIPPKR